MSANEKDYGDDGLTARQRVDTRKAELLEIQIAKERGELVGKDEVVAERRQVAEVIVSDLMSVGGRLSSRLASLKSSPEIKAAIDAEMLAIMHRWKDGGLVDES